jgi:peptide/nickel transport system substrate-binding protein
MGVTDVDQLVESYLAGGVSRRGFVKTGIALGLSMSALGGLLAACSNQNQSSQNAGSGTPKRGGTLREGYDLDFSRMDPINTTWYDPGFFALYDALVINDPNGSYVPQLAEKWSFSADGKTATFSIRKGAQFHSGRPLTAGAIKEVFDTIAQPNSGSPLQTLWVGPVASTEAPDDNTLIIHLKHPYYDLLNVVKTGYWRVVNILVRQKLGDQYGKQVIDGSGPFTFVDWVPGDHVTVKRWDNYPGSIVPFFQNKGKPYLDSIKWIAILEASQRAIQIENGQIDTLRGPAFQDVSRLMGNRNLNVIQLKSDWSGYVAGLNFTKTNLDFQDKRVRQAVSYAIDRQAIVKSLFFSYAEPMYGPVPTADKYYTKQVEQYNQFNLNKAKQLMSDAGWKPGADGILAKNGVKQQFSMVIQAESVNQQLASAVQAQLRALGMDVKVDAYDRGTYFNKLFSQPDAFLFFYQWPVPIDVVTLFINSAALSPNGPNWSMANIPEVDQAVAAWQGASNEKELADGGAKIQVAVADNLPIIPIVARQSFWVHRKNVHGWMPLKWDLYPYYNDVWLD